MKYREVITYKDYFEDFFKEQPQKILEGSNGLFEVRVQLGSNIFRIFCCFDGNRLVVLFSGFQKKTQKTPPKEIDRAVKIMNEYFNDKNEEQ